MLNLYNSVHFLDDNIKDCITVKYSKAKDDFIYQLLFILSRCQ
jgi:hypothetical protein